MKRSTRADLARDTVKIVEQGWYSAPGGERVELGASIRACLAGTALYSPSELERLRDALLARSTRGLPTAIDVVNETTMMGIARLFLEDDAPIAVLSFASAKNAGGGFLNGSQAQEESLARSSALHASLVLAPAFYELHRASSSLLYTDTMILSPRCPVFRNDAGELLEKPHEVTFLTSAAPNAGAAAITRPDELLDVAQTLRRRAECVLALAASHGYERLVLGAWGCGVFRNDPALVASVFAEHLRGAWSGRFARVVFSVLDDSAAKETVNAFHAAFADARGGVS